MSAGHCCTAPPLFQEDRMQARYSNMRESLHDVKAFLDGNADRLAMVATSGLRQKLDLATVRLDAFAEGQAGHDLAAKGTTQKYQAFRQALLRDHMSPIAGIAFTELPHTPELAPLRMPKGNPSVKNLALAATAMAHAAAPFGDLFITAGLPEDFIPRLTSASAAMVDSFRERSQTHGKRTGAARGVVEQLSEGRKIVRALDRLVTSALHDDPALLTNWKTVQRVRRVASSAGAASASGSDATAMATPPVSAPSRAIA
jgi:hypothetical protein